MQNARIDIRVSDTGSVHLSVFGHAGKESARYMFGDWRHFIAHFGDLLQLTTCPVHVGTYDEREPERS